MLKFSKPKILQNQHVLNLLKLETGIAGIMIQNNRDVRSSPRAGDQRRGLAAGNPGVSLAGKAKLSQNDVPVSNTGGCVFHSIIRVYSYYCSVFYKGRAKQLLAV